MPLSCVHKITSHISDVRFTEFAEGFLQFCRLDASCYATEVIVCESGQQHMPPSVVCLDYQFQVGVHLICLIAP